MMKHNFLSFIAVLLFLLQLPFSATGQEKVVNVERCKALNQASPIYNIWVDTGNIKWVANQEGLNKVLALDVVEKVPIPAGTTSLLMIRGGNAQMEWSTSAMAQLLGNVTITCASYDPKSKSIWIGTTDAGAFQVSLSPLRVLQRLNSDNKKLTSNQINDIFITNKGTIYIATDDGMLTGSGDRWTLQERYLNFIGVDAYGDNLWILGDDFLWQVDNKGKWSPIAIDLKNVEGQMRDIAVDDEGRVWIASNMMTGYDVAAEKYQRFGPGQYFTSQFVNCLDVDQDGSIWTGTNDKGLYLIQWESSMILSLAMDSPMDCRSSDPSGSISSKVAGGKPPYMYAWSNGMKTPKISGLGPGEYTVTVTDATGMTKAGRHSIPNPNITVLAEPGKPSTGGPDGTAKLFASGGAGQYIYTWDNGEATETALKLTPGTHTATVTDKSGCTAISAIVITENLTPLILTVNVIKDNKCAGAREGELRVEAKGGKAPYRYEWNAQSSTTPTLSNLSAGSYTVTVTDASGSTESISQVLALPTSVTASIQFLLPANVNTANGQALAKATGGKSPYAFAWDNGETIASIKSLSAGLHTVTVTDANGCSSTASINITENITEMNATITQTSDIKCNGIATAELNVEVIGGKGPYNYIWSTNQKTKDLKDQKSGLYQVTVTDLLGSIVTANYTVPEPQPVNVILQIDAPATSVGNDGKVTAKATGGSGIFDFIWDNGEKSNKAIRLSAGLHRVTVTDGNGCSTTGEVEIPENLLALQVTIDQTTEIKCAGDPAANIIPTVTGGKGPYTYAWNNKSTSSSLSNIKEGLYILTVTDATGHTATFVITVDAPLPLEIALVAESAATTNASNGRAVVNVKGGKEKYTYLWDNGEKTSRAEKLNAGNHTMTVTDANGCMAKGNVMIDENILALSAEISQDNEIQCAGYKTASLSAAVKGGKEPFSYLWKGGGQEWTTGNISNIGSGNYTLQVTDVTGKVLTKTVEIKEPAQLQIAAQDIVPASTGNANGQLTLKVNGGKAPFLLGGSFSSKASSSSFDIIKLSPGPYQFVVTDASGCSAETSVTITEDILPLTVSIKQTNPVLCAGTAQASLEGSVKGGKSPYTYSWSNGQSGQTASGLAVGSYTLSITDASGQKATIDYKIAAPPAMDVAVSNLRSTTNDRIHDGKGGVEIKGGTAPYTYQWNSSETTASASKLPLGSGKVIVTDQNGCTASAEFIIKQKVLADLTAERLASGEPIRMEKIQFQADSVKIEPEAFPSLDELYDFLYDNPTTIIEVAGHTNGLPADDYCDRISSERAQSVADYLTNKGIEARRVISKGYGKRKPVATNQTPEGRKKNQRVEIRLIKIEE